MVWNGAGRYTITGSGIPWEKQEKTKTEALLLELETKAEEE